MIKKLLKQFFCSHDSIETQTESYNPENLFIVKSIIKCKNCGKSFAQHPNAQCCYVNHMHGEIMRDYWLSKYKNMKQET